MEGLNIFCLDLVLSPKLITISPSIGTPPPLTQSRLTSSDLNTDNRVGIECRNSFSPPRFSPFLGNLPSQARL